MRDGGISSGLGAVLNHDENQERELKRRPPCVLRSVTAHYFRSGSGTLLLALALAGFSHSEKHPLCFSWKGNSNRPLCSHITQDRAEIRFAQAEMSGKRAEARNAVRNRV